MRPLETIPGKSLSQMIVERRERDTRTVWEIAEDTDEFHRRVEAGEDPMDVVRDMGLDRI